jgi:phosphomannomutase/phosphoglucomutase
MSGLCAAGLDVVDLGTLPTPMVYYAKDRLNAAGSAIITASHNAADINGLKWMLGDRPPTPEEVAAMGREERGERREESEKQSPKTQAPRPKT